MGLHNYLWLVIKTAWKHSLHAAHSIILILIIGAGLVTHFVPGIQVMVDLHGWETATIVLAAIIGVRLFLAPYWIWKADQNRIKELSANDPTARKLEIVFDENDKRCVVDEPDWYGGVRARRWRVGIRNSSLVKSIDDISIAARKDHFVDCTIRIAHAAPGQRPSRDNPIILEINTLPPGAEEFVELFGLSPNDDWSEGDIFAKKNRFVLEARGRDSQTVFATLEYDPSSRPIVIRRIF